MAPPCTNFRSLQPVCLGTPFAPLYLFRTSALVTLLVLMRITRSTGGSRGVKRALQPGCASLPPAGSGVARKENKNKQNKKRRSRSAQDSRFHFRSVPGFVILAFGACEVGVASGTSMLCTKYAKGIYCFWVKANPFGILVLVTGTQKEYVLF